MCQIYVVTKNELAASELKSRVHHATAVLHTNYMGKNQEKFKLHIFIRIPLY